MSVSFVSFLLLVLFPKVSTFFRLRHIISLYVKKLSYLCTFKVSHRMLLTINNELFNNVAFFGDAGNVPLISNEAVTFHEALRAP